MLTPKQQRRKEQHSIIEKRRRERTNRVLGHLRQLVPRCRVQNALDKVTILEEAVIYIQQLEDQLGKRSLNRDALMSVNNLLN
ncbi:Myc-type, basic helix-loop-helix domain-containing protein [Gorgonomyces haynaldii]|nr:Myc-type, basic helix-loop-helix domain-containing protein [Gorgonomyces haynaldii]